uniref:RRM domain-containing protein n=1 Tax=Chromera velia CCMP2878 TaxID=1169474 RepID=A0A0G4HQW2_9ALVE|eukprot:Cvel_30331.t1-p1 / transcript=Cvel_30331.t1 / gene=Cvel_30331 / organism=Chromera_velia_CCMP2878 / gene_product=Flowering time control protein FCA, putative / transcript_product=Flowering time control protein FCA, putative / location=Cvel_scaffold4306:3450-9009(-) / protein_length=1138 / sequence_SO=supercontig / SO=protein_coding / is_pseudo=false
MPASTEFFRTFRTPADASGWLPPELVASGRTSVPVKIFVNRVPPKTTESALSEYFRPYGRHLSVEIVKRSGSRNLIAFVTMESVLAAHQAIAALHNRMTLQAQGTPCRVVYAENELERLKLPQSLQPGYGSVRLFVGNLPANVTIDDIARLFKPFGPLLEVHLLPAKDGKPAAFVVFRKFHDGLVAMGNLNGTPLEQGGAELTVRFAANEKLPAEFQPPAEKTTVTKGLEAGLPSCSVHETSGAGADGGSREYVFRSPDPPLPPGEGFITPSTSTAGVTAAAVAAAALSSLNNRDSGGKTSSGPASSDDQQQQQKQKNNPSISPDSQSRPVFAPSQGRGRQQPEEYARHDQISQFPYVRQPRDPLNEDNWGYLAADSLEGGVAAGWVEAFGAPAQAQAGLIDPPPSGGSGPPPGFPSLPLPPNARAPPPPQHTTQPPLLGPSTSAHGAGLRGNLSSSGLVRAAADIVQTSGPGARSVLGDASTSAVAAHVDHCRNVYEEALRIQALVDLLGVSLNLRGGDGGIGLRLHGVHGEREQTSSEASGTVMQAGSIPSNNATAGTAPSKIAAVEVERGQSASTSSASATSGSISVPPGFESIPSTNNSHPSRLFYGAIPQPPPEAQARIPRRREQPPPYYEDLYVTAAERYHCRHPGPGLPDLRDSEEDQLPWVRESEVAYRENTLYTLADVSAPAVAARASAATMNYQEGAAYHSTLNGGAGWDSAAAGAYVEAPLRFGLQDPSTVRYGNLEHDVVPPPSRTYDLRHHLPPFDPNLGRHPHLQQREGGATAAERAHPPGFSGRGTIAVPGEFVGVSEARVPYASNLRRSDIRLAAASTPMDRPDLFAPVLAAPPLTHAVDPQRVAVPIPVPISNPTQPTSVDIPPVAVRTQAQQAQARMPLQRRVLANTTSVARQPHTHIPEYQVGHTASPPLFADAPQQPPYPVAPAPSAPYATTVEGIPARMASPSHPVSLVTTEMRTGDGRMQIPPPSVEAGLRGVPVLPHTVQSSTLPQFPSRSPSLAGGSIYRELEDPPVAPIPTVDAYGRPLVVAATGGGLGGVGGPVGGRLPPASSAEEMERGRIHPVYPGGQPTVPPAVPLSTAELQQQQQYEQQLVGLRKRRSGETKFSSRSSDFPPRPPEPQ